MSETVRRFRIGHFPKHTRDPDLRTDLRFIKELNVLSGGLTEMSYDKDDVMAVLGPSEKQYRVYWDSHRGRPIEIPMFVDRLRVDDHEFKYIPVSPGDPDSRIVKPRGVSILKFTYRGRKAAQIHTHWDAVLQNRSTGELVKAKRVRYARENSKTIERVARRLIEQGYAVFITGDFNYRDFHWLARFRLWWHSPQRMFKRLGLAWYNSRLDYLAWDPHRVHKLGIQEIPPGHKGNHGDHPYIIGSFIWAA